MGLLLTAGGCDDAAPDEPTAPILALTDGLYTTLQGVWTPRAPAPETRTAMASGQVSVYAHDEFEEAGLGITLEDGLPWIDRSELAPDFEAGADGARRSVTWFWAAADPQVIDEESPIRFEAFKAIYRPQGHLMPQSFEAHVRTAAGLARAAARPFDFAVVAGDLTDGSQKNELQWFITALTGGAIDPDSGDDDDPIPGPGNDYNDPFWSDGLGAAWFATLGNHDGLYNGGFGELSDEVLTAAVSGDVYVSGLFDNGFRDGSTLDGALRTQGPTPADPYRRPLRHRELLQALHDAPQAGGAPAGHGYTQEAVDTGKGWFSTSPAEGVPVRLVVLDTSFHQATGPAAGVQGFIGTEQHEWLVGELAAAAEAGDLVVVMTHHRTKDFARNSDVSGEQLEDTLRATPNVVLHLTGHGHRNRARLMTAEDGDPATAAAGYWELMTASTVDFPIQSRIIEIVDEGTGHVSIYVTNIDHNSPVGSMGHEARRLAAAKWAFGDIGGPPDIEHEWAAEVAAMNLILRVPLPEGARQRLADADLDAVISSERTLATLDAPRAD